VYAYVDGEQALPTGLRRFLVAERDVPKDAITFQGYWRQGRAAAG
jgi:NADPH-dependent ferric siderophore reductase